MNMKPEKARRAKSSSGGLTLPSFLRFSLIAMSLSICSMAYSQSNVTINLPDATVEDVLNAIQSQTGYKVVYNNNDVALEKKVSVNVRNGSIEEVVKQAFAGQNIAFKVTDNHIVLSKQQGGTSSTGSKIKVSGKVTDPAGEGLTGASIVEKGTNNGTIADIDGNFTLSVDPNAILTVSYIGYDPKDIRLDGKTSLNIVLSENARILQEVVVTALGIKKKEKSLTYSTQIVGGEELTRAKDPNMINALAGKTAGVQINKSSSGLGGSSKVVIRGNRSASGNNQPLYVIDGVPINNNLQDQTTTTVGGTNDASNRDGGDGISNLNPDDIESMNILKGPAAAALYGSQAANGVVVITTKKGKTGRTDIAFNSNTTWEQAAFGIPEFQNSYTGTVDSWGSKITGENPDYTDDFFKTGVTTINSLSLSSGSEKMQTYFSYANTYGQAVLPNNNMLKHNFNFRETANFFDNKLTVDANINLLHQKLNNRTTPGGYYLNPLVGLYTFPRGGIESGNTMSYYKDYYKQWDVSRNMYLQNWYLNNDMNQNPYWLLNMTPSEDTRTRTIGNLSLSYKMNDKFTLQARGNADFIADKFDQKMYAGTHPSLAGENGRYIIYEANNLNTYGDVLLTYQGKFAEVFALNASVGGSITDQRIRSSRLDSRGKGVGLFYPNKFIIGNMDLNGGYILQEDIHRQEQSVFFAGQLGYRDWLFLDVTARNDWSSTLAFTESDKTGFFYPSVGLTWVINESLPMPEWVNLGKVRGAWSQVGNSLPLYISKVVNGIAAGGNFLPNTTAPFDKLKPEQTRSLEFGTEWKFLGNRLDFDFTYYKTNTTNQLFSLPAPAGSGYSLFYVNAGDIENYGIEVVLGGYPVMNDDFKWKTTFNYAMNRNKILELADGLDYFVFGQAANTNYQMRLEEGGSFGDIYGRAFKRDANGNIEYNANGLPINDEEADLTKIGNTASKWNLGWGNSFTYKDFSLYFLIDCRFGGDVMSITQADLDASGVSKTTGDARDAGFVSFDNKQFNPKDFYTTVGGRSGITEYYLYDATNIRLRELSVGYALPQNILGRSNAVKKCELSLIARNLFFFKNNAPYDPDASMSTGNNLQGVDTYGMPTNRSFGFNLKVNF